MPSSQYILVTGDFILDRHIYKGERRHYGDRRSRSPGRHELRQQFRTGKALIR